MGKIDVSATTTTNTFGYLHIGAKFLLSEATKSEEGQFYNLMSCLVLSAFTLEAYLNHFGQSRNAEWNEIERKYPKLKKYEMFCKKCGIKYNFQKRPYSTMRELFKYRDSMAHGKTTTDYIKKTLPLKNAQQNELTAEPEWKEYVSIQNAQKAISDVENIVHELHSAGGLNGSNPFNDLATSTIFTTLQP